MTSAFRRILLIAGSALVLQGMLDLVLGPWLHLLSTASGEVVSAGSDSDARFLGGLLLAVGVVWIVLSRRAEVPVLAVQLLAGGMIVGAGGRLVSVAVAGPGSWLATVLIAVEILSSTAVIVLSVLASRAASAPTTVEVVCDAVAQRRSELGAR